MSVSLTLEKTTPADRLASIADSVRNGEPPTVVTVREFLSWFGAYRRGYNVVQRIRKLLAQAGLVTTPDFESTYIDHQIALRPADLPHQESPPAPSANGASPAALAPAHSDGASLGISDPTYRIGMFPAANHPPVYVAPDDSLEKAITLMLTNDFSQLPVMTNERTVKGVTTWRSIAARWALEKNGTSAKDFLEDHVPEIGADRSLFEAIPVIIQYGYVLVRDATNKISGIVTATDLSEQFQQLAEPFLLIGEIERHIRRLIEGKFTKEELASLRESEDRPVDSVIELNFGQYGRLLEQPTMWPKLGLGVERATFCKQLDAVRLIRNEVMHFDPDPIAASDLGELRRFARFLQTLQAYGV